MRVLVTGGAGYIGSHAVRALRRAGHDPVVFDNLSRGFERLVRGYKLIRGDIGDREAVLRALSGCDAIMHFAAFALVGESVENPRLYYHNNVEKALVLLNATVDAGIRRFIFSSTCAVYGIPGRMPISEDMPKDPVNPYGTTKLVLENALSAYSRAYGMRYVALRYFNACGADASGECGELHDPETHLIPNALKAAAGEQALQLFGSDYPTPDGTCIRDYIHVSDLADAHLAALEYLASGGPSVPLNVGTGRGASNLEIVAEVERLTGRSVRVDLAPPRAGDPPVLFADPTRAARILGWRAKRDLTTIITTAWNWTCKERLHTKLEAAADRTTERRLAVTGSARD
ncbi:MAG TPA: UDP-glucose 4-epimerase GalE [Terriglobales bacterium]|nr:UDP-glucose 4-epimerase GalE [Terriglobales bacterium]